MKDKHGVDIWIRNTGTNTNTIICRISRTALIFVEDKQFRKLLFIASIRELENSIKLIRIKAVYKMERSNKFRNKQHIVIGLSILLFFFLGSKIKHH